MTETTPAETPDVHLSDEDLGADAPATETDPATGDDAPADTGGAAQAETPPADDPDPGDVDAGRPAPTEAQVQALAQGLAAQAHQAIESERSYREAEARDEVFTVSDPAEALEQIRVLNVEVVAKEREWSRLKELAGDAKKSYDSAAKRLTDLIQELTGDLNPAQPKLAVVRETHSVVAGEKARCTFERLTGQPCGVCRSRAADAPTPDVESREHPDHAEHEAIARAEAIERLSAALLPRNAVLHPVVLSHLSDDELAQLHAWAETPGPVPPAILARAHVAEAPGSDYQSCTRCGGILRQVSDLEATKDDGASTPEGWIPEGAFYGLTCDGEERAAATEDAPETARKVATRGAKKGRKKHDPETERAEQVKAGKAKAAKAPKAKKGR